MYDEIYHTLWGYPEKFERSLEWSENKLQDRCSVSPLRQAWPKASPEWSKSPSEFDEVKRGEIMVCLMTNPAWVIVFSKIKGVVTDAGGVLSHTAVVSREFGIPAVVGTGDATRRIKTGDRIRVNGLTRYR
jgi:phosphohistidine swiveling domain-containing protein